FPAINLGSILVQPYTLTFSVTNAPAPMNAVRGAAGSMSARGGADETGGEATQAIPGYFSMTSVVVTNGVTQTLGVGDPTVASATFDFAPPEPHPFINATQLEFSIASREQVRARLFDLSGRVVRTLADQEMGPGRHTLAW